MRGDSHFFPYASRSSRRRRSKKSNVETPQSAPQSAPPPFETPQPAPPHPQTPQPFADEVDDTAERLATLVVQSPPRPVQLRNRRRVSEADQVLLSFASRLLNSTDSFAQTALQQESSSNSCFHKHQGETEFCYIYALVTALGYMVFLQKLYFDSLPKLTKMFISVLTNLYGWNVLDLDYATTEMLVTEFDKRYIAFLNEDLKETTQKLTHKSLLRPQSPAIKKEILSLQKLKSFLETDLKRDVKHMNGGLAHITWKVLASESFGNPLQAYTYRYMYVLQDKTSEMQLDQEFLDKQCTHWYVCLIGLRPQGRNGGHWISAVNLKTCGGKEGIQWFNTLSTTEYVPKNVAKNAETPNIVEDLIYIIDADEEAEVWYKRFP